jgi:hypothetical protein
LFIVVGDDVSVSKLSRALVGLTLKASPIGYEMLDRSAGSMRSGNVVELVVEALVRWRWRSFLVCSCPTTAAPGSIVTMTIAAIAVGWNRIVVF